MHTLQQLLSGELKGSKHLKLINGLAEFPNEIYSLAESLEILDLSGNRLSSLPHDFGRLSKLKIVFFSDNLFTELPKVLADCKQLSMIGFKANQIERIPEGALPETTRWLILTNNKITELPPSIGKCSLLQKVALAGNLLTALPPEMANCRNLELLRISANKLDTLPDWLFDLPKLSWLAFAGNPFSETKQNIKDLNFISWNEFEIQEQLGEGASGNIYKALWRNRKEVAIKVFKGEVTSDGFPDDEMLASVLAGTHQNLVTLLGEIKEHPQQKQGLVMELIPSRFYNLGLPPNFETCSRDTFEERTHFPAGQILKIVSAIASAVRHLHAKGIMHGDLYAHNILIDEDSNALISDFGAASMYDLFDTQAKKTQQIESRAFGCLLEDLLLRIAPTDKDLKLTSQLTELKDKAMQQECPKRPLFFEINTMLEVINKECLPLVN